MLHKIRSFTGFMYAPHAFRIPNDKSPPPRIASPIRRFECIQENKKKYTPKWINLIRHASRLSCCKRARRSQRIPRVVYPNIVIRLCLRRAITHYDRPDHLARFLWDFLVLAQSNREQQHYMHILFLSAITYKHYAM